MVLCPTHRITTKVSSSVAEPSTRISVVRPDWQAPRTVRVFNTTRRGGVSQAPFDSLNLGLHVNDDALSVHENRRLLTTAEALPEEPRWLRQTPQRKSL